MMHQATPIFFILLGILCLVMYIVAVKEKSQLIKNRERGIIDHYLNYQDFESLIRTILNNKKLSPEEKATYYKKIDDFIKQLKEEISKENKN